MSIERLQKYLVSRGESADFVSLTADASTREYFRIGWKGGSAVACVYPEPFEPSDQSYLDVTRLFLAAGLPVAEVFDVDGELGVIVQEDIGDQILYNVLKDADAESRADLLDEAIRFIARIQAATEKAFEMRSIASRLKFDTEKLLWELNYFKSHYFETYLKSPLSRELDEAMTAEFITISNELEARASVLCHRDFHAANLMIDGDGRMRIIDHQDARLGSAAYDLVSLLLDRVTDLPSDDWLLAKRRLFLSERQKLGLTFVDDTEFTEEFRLQTIQRCLKAAGTFSFQSVNRGKTYFVPFINPMLTIAIQAAEDLDRFPVIRETLGREIDRSHT